MKTYKQFKKFLRDKCWNERDYGEGIYDKLIYDFLVEEVKEKPLSQKRAEAIERGKQHSTEYYSALSILEKLREEIQRKATSSHWMERDVGRELLVFLTSLEQPQTKKEPTYMKSMGWKATPEGNIIVPQFTPGQEIEVSFDGEKWWKREYVNYEPSLWHFGVSKYCTIYRAENGCLKEKWEFARPIKIEPELPEFSYDRYDEENNLVEQVHEIGVQVEALTTFCQALARQKTTK